MTMKASGMEITTDSVMNTKAYVDPDKLKDAQMEITGTTTTKVTAPSRRFEYQGVLHRRRLLHGYGDGPTQAGSVMDLP